MTRCRSLNIVNIPEVDIAAIIAQLYTLRVVLPYVIVYITSRRAIEVLAELQSTGAGFSN